MARALPSTSNNLFFSVNFTAAHSPAATLRGCLCILYSATIYMNLVQCLIYFALFYVWQKVLCSFRTRSCRRQCTLRLSLGTWPLISSLSPPMNVIGTVWCYVASCVVDQWLTSGRMTDRTCEPLSIRNLREERTRRLICLEAPASHTVALN